jgi:hypothetical protein
MPLHKKGKAYDTTGAVFILPDLYYQILKLILPKK